MKKNYNFYNVLNLQTIRNILKTTLFLTTEARTNKTKQKS